MIVTKVFYGVKCDRCGDIGGDSEYQYWDDEQYAIDDSICADWIEHNHAHYCPDCYSWDDEGDIVICDPYPKHLNQTINFIQAIGGYSISVIRREEQFDLKFSFSRYSRFVILEDHEVQYLTGLLGDKLIDMNRESFTTTIKIKK